MAYACERERDYTNKRAIIKGGKEKDVCQTNMYDVLVRKCKED